MPQAKTACQSNKTGRIVLSRSQIGQLYLGAVPSLRFVGKDEAKGLCPFHDDRRPSFSVNMREGVWFCHAGCGGGNIFQFLARYQGVKVKDVDQILERQFQ
jgi:DNA primase